MLLVGALMPSTAKAGVFDPLIPVRSLTPPQDTPNTTGNLQTMELPKPSLNYNPAPATGGGDVSIVDGSAVVPQDGPSGTIADIVKPKNGTIVTYIVREGDTLSSIAKMYDIPQSTILWANNLTSKSIIKPGDKLTILPVPGITYTVKKGDSLASIAHTYGGDAGDIASFNGIDDATLAVGTDIIIPNGELASPVTRPISGSSSKKTSNASKVTTKSKIINEPAHDVGPQGTARETAYYAPPLASYTETQGIHGYNAVDLAAPAGTPITASATGDVIVAREGGWNGGYGSYVVISHNNGSQTLYAHMSKVATYDGAHVRQGEVIGYVGATGKVTGKTGNHLHFEIRNGIKNPF